MINAGVLTPGMQKRMEKARRASVQPGHYRVGEGTGGPVGGRVGDSERGLGNPDRPWPAATGFRPWRYSVFVFVFVSVFQ